MERCGLQMTWQVATNVQSQAWNMRPFCDFPVALSSLYHQVSFVYIRIQMQRALAAPQLLHLTEPVKHSPRKRWIPGLITDPLIWAVRRPHSGLWVNYRLLYVPCVLYMHTLTLNKTFLPTLHTCSRCRVSYDTSTGGVDAGAALGRESEYVFHSKENKELSRALDLPGFHCRMVLTFSQKSIQFQVFQ